MLLNTHGTVANMPLKSHAVVYGLLPLPLHGVIYHFRHAIIIIRHYCYTIIAISIHTFLHTIVFAFIYAHNKADIYAATLSLRRHCLLCRHYYRCPARWHFVCVLNTRIERHY